MQHPTQTGRLHRGFTLIELLTVIAIIGILAAILIPTVAKVRQSARNSQCIAQLRDWGRVITLYANDNKGNYYTLNWASVAPADAPMGRNYQPYYNSSKWEGFRMRYCPADPETPTLMLNTGGEDPRYVMIRGYINGDINNIPAEDKTKPPAMPLSRASAPSQFMMMVDAVAYAGSDFRVRSNDATGMQKALEPLTTVAKSQRHGGSKFNAVFGDSSVKRVGWSTTALTDRTNVFAMKGTWMRLN